VTSPSDKPDSRDQEPTRSLPQRLIAALGGLLLSLVSVLATLLALEAGLRLIDGVPFKAENYIAAKVSLLAKAYPTVYDPLLGFAPRPDYDSADNAWGTQVTLDHRGIRFNGKTAPPETAPVLAVGDSFTFGDEVSDDESWPALLEGMIGEPVLNAGVFNYGLDQVVLRTEKLLPETKAKTLILSFVYGDVRRSQAAQRTGVEKPYFTVDEAGELQLNNVPPSPNRPRPEQLGMERTVLGYSYLADWVMRRLGKEEWWYAGGNPQIFAHHDGPRVACLLLQRLRAFAEEQGVLVMIVAEYFPRNFTEPQNPKSVEEIAGTADLLACARDQGFITVDTFAPFQRAIERDRDAFFELIAGAHFSRQGNRIVASMIAEAYDKRVRPLLGEGGHGQ